MRTTIRDVQAMKRRGERIAMVTAYDTPSAALVDRAGLPIILVGDSLGMVVHGHSTTLPVTLEDMVRHAAAVVRGSTAALVVGDLPFLTYANLEDAVRASGRMMQEAGVQAVKLEGAGHVVPIIQRLVQLGVPVMGHLGYTPQSTHQLGARAQAKDADAAQKLLDDALALEAAGAFAVVLELVPKALGRKVSQSLAIPVIGIGAGVGCDGQVQVWHDILGLFDGKPPRHAKVYAEIGKAIEAALKAYADEVRQGAFPTDAQSVAAKKDDA
ncbi:MAG TPA: 3-methyl-2-oxobutanoate hydroxymethyltransferase [Caulobacteraceae bacterium]|jgi:3-methyl-2-oxobutanoate hydroxymethyltransferase